MRCLGCGMVGLFLQHTHRSVTVRRDLREQQTYLLVATSTAVIGAITQYFYLYHSNGQLLVVARVLGIATRVLPLS